MWCAENGHRAVPADPTAVVVAFVDEIAGGMPVGVVGRCKGRQRASSLNLAGLFWVVSQFEI